MDNALNKLKHTIEVAIKECRTLEEQYDKRLKNLTVWEDEWMELSINKNKIMYSIGALNELKEKLK